MPVLVGSISKATYMAKVAMLIQVAKLIHIVKFMNQVMYGYGFIIWVGIWWEFQQDIGQVMPKIDHFKAFS